MCWDVTRYYARTCNRRFSHCKAKCFKRRQADYDRSRPLPAPGLGIIHVVQHAHARTDSKFVDQTYNVTFLGAGTDDDHVGIATAGGKCLNGAVNVLISYEPTHKQNNWTVHFER